MGRYQVNLKCAEIKNLVDEQQYKKALDIADTLDIDKVNSIVDLKTIAGLYERVERYQDAKEVLLRSYEKKITKSVLYRLTYLSLKTEEYEDAEEFYEEFAKLSPESQDRYILRYGIDRAKGVDYYLRIATLQKLKQIEYMEDWGYELAKVYHKAGLSEECIAECEDLVLWFGEGTIVEKAKLLRKYHLEGKESLDAYGVFDEKKREQMRKKRIKADTATKDLGAQIQAITEYQQKADIQKELTRDMEKTVNLQNVLGDELQNMDLFGKEVRRSWGVYAGNEATEFSEQLQEEEVQEEVPSIEQAQGETIDLGRLPSMVSEFSQENLSAKEDSQEEMTQSFKKQPVKTREREKTMRREAMVTERIQTVKPFSKKVTAPSEPPKTEKYHKGDKPLFSADTWLHLAKKVEQEQFGDEMEEFIDKESLKIVPKDTEIVIDGIDITEYFGEFVNEPKTRLQLITELSRAKQGERPFHIIMTCEDKQRGMELAKDLGKSFQKLGILKTTKVAKTTAEKLNKMHLEEKREELKQSCVVVGDAKDMTPDTAQSLMNLIEETNDEMVVILLDTSQAIEEMLSEYNVLLRYFRYNIEL